MANVKATDLITFTRASKGHALAKVSYGDELVTNGDFATDTTGWSTNNSTVSVVSGRLRVTDAGTSALAYQAVTTEVGKIYRLNFDYLFPSGNTNADYQVHVRKDTFGGTALASKTTGWVEDSETEAQLIFVATSTTSVVVLQPASATNDYADFDNVSVKEVTFDQPDGTLQLFEHPDNIPRIEYDASGNLLGLLVEESRTNLIPSSQAFDVATWAKGGSISVTDNVVTAPDGTQTGCLVTAADDTTDYLVRSSVTSNGQTKSIWARTVSGTGKVTLLGHNSVSAAMFDLTETWQRFDLPVDTSQVGGSNFYAVDFRGAAATLTEVYIWGAQLETGNFPTSYIKNEGNTSGKTRSADVASIDVDQFGFNTNEGSVFCEVQHFTTESSVSAAGFALDDGTSSNRMYYYQNKGQWIVSVSGTTTVSIDDSDPAENTSTKVGVAYKLNDYVSNIDGSLVGSDTSSGVPTVTTLHLGRSSAGTALNGHIKSLNYYPKRLSNAKLQELTS